MKLPLYQVDAFADRVFTGNPAAVVPLQQWIDDDLMQQLAMENNLAETVFFVPRASDEFDIRWFTPEKEINLCGHATLASAFVLFNHLDYKNDSITFHSQSGPLRVWRNAGGMIFLDFPSWKPQPMASWPHGLEQALGVDKIVAAWQSRDLLIELKDEDAVRGANPDFTLLKRMGHKVIITARGKEVDFVSRFFAPTYGIDEDPVTGSAHSQLIPFWSERLSKTDMRASQLSKRSGHLVVAQRGDRVEMGGRCVFYMKGELNLPD